MAGEPGFEPRSPGPEPGVLPLNYSPMERLLITILNHPDESRGPYSDSIV